MGEYTGGFSMPKTYVLLVDDEKEFIEAMAERLTIRGYQVFCSSTGEDALDQLGKEPDIDVAVLDLQMPRIGGIEILQEIKKIHPLVQVIMLTGHSTLSTAIEAMKLGAFDYLMKPCDTERLIVLINEAAALKKKFAAQILEARQIPYISELNREQLITIIMETAAKGRRSDPDE